MITKSIKNAPILFEFIFTPASFYKLSLRHRDSSVKKIFLFFYGIITLKYLFDLGNITVAKNFGCKSVLIERKESDLHVGEKEASSKTATLSRDYGQDFTINKMHELLDILI